MKNKKMKLARVECDLTQEQLAEKMERWVYLNDLNDRIQAQGK